MPLIRSAVRNGLKDLAIGSHLGSHLGSQVTGITLSGDASLSLRAAFCRSGSLCAAACPTSSHPSFVLRLEAGLAGPLAILGSTVRRSFGHGGASHGEHRSRRQPCASPSTPPTTRERWSSEMISGRLLRSAVVWSVAWKSRQRSP